MPPELVGLEAAGLNHPVGSKNGTGYGEALTPVAFFGGHHLPAGLVEIVEHDRFEAQLIRAIFRSDLADLDKILLRDLVYKVGAISDYAQTVGDRIRIIVVKRMV